MRTKVNIKVRLQSLLDGRYFRDILMHQVRMPCTMANLDTAGLGTRVRERCNLWH